MTSKKTPSFLPSLSKFLLLALLLLNTVACTTARTNKKVLISVPDQRMVLLNKGKPTKSYPVSTSKYGLGDRPGSYRTPIGKMMVAKKIGRGAPKGAVFKSRRRTGEILRPNAPGRDPIVTRILWLKGLERHNANTMQRLIYIHGTPEERKIGRPASYGCIRMRSKDVIDLYNKIPVGTVIQVTPKSLRSQSNKQNTTNDKSFANRSRLTKKGSS